ncbi:hypothetical protein CHELA40_10792 [Chelatococcus asaccharovorans]|nr:hypothetical protein CHELA40_10792 [Chelatococcus asaccharovorans]CAH1686051.1 hypothetical protein CHELA17_64813 [Chelatococcus asaccharovorans]
MTAIRNDVRAVRGRLILLSRYILLFGGAALMLGKNNIGLNHSRNVH